MPTIRLGRYLIGKAFYAVRAFSEYAVVTPRLSYVLDWQGFVATLAFLTRSLSSSIRHYFLTGLAGQISSFTGQKNNITYWNMPILSTLVLSVRFSDVQLARLSK